jgi:hypothetical protein
MKKKKLKIFLLVLTIILLIPMGTLVFMRYIYVPRGILKTAIKENKIDSDSYILARQVWVTGYEWVCIQNLSGERISELCNIIGANPLFDLNLGAEFELAKNTFIFYVEERKEYYCEKTHLNIVEYYVSGWDILFPVKHSDLDFFGSRWHITEDDVSTWRR